MVPKKNAWSSDGYHLTKESSHIYEKTIVKYMKGKYHYSFYVRFVWITHSDELIE